MPYAPPSPAGPRYRGRFAPSPTGPLHLGSLMAALGSWLIARHQGGEWLVRVEDLDPPREPAGMADHQLRTLAAFGLRPDAPPVRQGQRHALYQAALDSLLGQGLAFECRCSRADLQATAGIHRQCVRSPSGRRPAVRLRVPAGVTGFDDAIRGRYGQDLARDVGDFVLLRADGFWAYQLAVVVDDARQGITEVVRGADLLDSTPRQLFLQRALGLPSPRHAHLPVLRRANGEKLGKSLGSTPVDADDPLPALRAAFGFLGQDPRALGAGGDMEQALSRALAAFDPGRIPAQDCLLPHE